MEPLKLVYATGNEAKFRFMEDALKGLPIRLMPLKRCSVQKFAPEDGDSAIENAKRKADFYFRELRVPLFSCDSALTIANIPENLQPGVRIRRVGGRTLTDEEMIEYYCGLAKTYGPLQCRYRNAIAVVFDERRRIESDAVELAGDTFFLLEEPFREYLPGFPLDAMSVEKTDQNVCETSQCGCRRFFQSIL